MSKYQKGNFAIVPKDIMDKGLSLEEIGLYTVLKILENNYCTNQEKGFFHTDKKLAEITHKNDRTIEKLRKKLMNAGVIKWTKKHFEKDGKVSYQRIGYFEFINEDNKKDIPISSTKKDTPKKNAPNFTERQFDGDMLERELFAMAKSDGDLFNKTIFANSKPP